MPQTSTSERPTEDFYAEFERRERERRKNDSPTYHELRAKFRSHIDSAAKESTWTFVEAPSEIAESETPSVEKERLRCFLSHILSVSYSLEDECPDRLRKDDWIRYLHLTKLAFEVFNSHHPPSRGSSIVLDWSDECCHHPDVDRLIKAPAFALGIEASTWLLHSSWPTLLTSPGTAVAMLCGFFRRSFWPLASPFGMNIRLEVKSGAIVFADMLLKDQHSVVKALNPTDGTAYPDVIWRRHEARRRGCFSSLESPLEFTINELGFSNFEDYDLAGQLMEGEADNLRAWFERAEYMKAAMEGFPGDVRYAWWKRHVIARWARFREKRMFKE